MNQRIAASVAVFLGSFLAVWSQLFLHDDMRVLRVVLLIVGVALAGAALAVAGKAKNEKKGKK
ncbi:hypothetical protein CSA80_00885 [Candidatus Saccharibacteria bacterium]|nr:MAG: hypothetical protein CR973_02270 [Candidatus Saccharibacteria bacterium]PID99309.1 MAG: hypothetical protein CSA80_00885 [Candidatus Saccharibacteria bacterium]